MQCWAFFQTRSRICVPHRYTVPWFPRQIQQICGSLRSLRTSLLCAFRHCSPVHRPSSKIVWWMMVQECLYVQVASQTSDFPLFHGKIVTPSARFPSSRIEPGVSNTLFTLDILEKTFLWNKEIFEKFLSFSGINWVQSWIKSHKSRKKSNIQNYMPFVSLKPVLILTTIYSWIYFAWTAL